MADIAVLDKQTIDKIAAGEVVERPASVVKELVENAIDAAATAVTVEIKDGGTSLIRVTDNGKGIEKPQVKTAFLRHATSKIKTAEDLLHVTSLGFRGEALSSIAAVSQTELITKVAADLTGVRYVINGGEGEEPEEIGAPEGTTILVRSLFYNTPARRKFLRTGATEGGYVSDLMEHLAMSMPHISFQFIVNGQTKFHTSGNGDLKEIIYRIYGREIAGELLEVSYSENLENSENSKHSEEGQKQGLRIHGWIGKPIISRASRSFEHYFVNNRYIKSDILAKAIEEGYKTYLMQHKYPFVVLHFMIDTERIDVNVHPTKMDIRFTNQRELFDTIVSVLKDALSEKELIPQVTLEKEEHTQDVVADQAKIKHRNPEPFEQKRIYDNVVREEQEYGKKEEKTPIMQEFLQNMIANKVIGSTNLPETHQNEKKQSNVLKAKDHIFVEKVEQMTFFDTKLLTQEAKAEYKILGQLFDTYWLLAFSDKLFLVDQHAAHEKVKYEKLVQKVKDKQVTSQLLNPPVIITLSGREESVLKQYEAYFQVLGFELEEFGGNEIAIRSVPADLYGCGEKELFEEILDELSEGALKGTPNVVEEKLASMACKAAVKGNHLMSGAEIEQLLADLLELENPYFCPHGRPTIISMSKYEIDKKFKRIL